MIKLVIFDLDGVINDGWDLLPSLRSKLDDLHRTGVKLAINSSRDALGVLFFTVKAGFPFDYVCSRPGIVISRPLERPLVSDLFDTDTMGYILPSFSIDKINRVAELMRLCGVTTPTETLFIDDGPLPEHMAEAELLKCQVASPASNNIDWLDFVKKRGGYISKKSCGRGTLEILNHYFPGAK